MRSARSANSPEIIFASANVAHPIDRVRCGFNSPEAVGTFAQEAGCDGVEVHPIHWPPQRILAARRGGSLAVSSLHMSFLTSKRCAATNLDAFPLKERLLNPILRLALHMPYVDESARWMGEVQRGLEQRVPAVYYPLRHLEDNATALNAGGAELNTFQPTDHVARLLGAKSVEDLWQKAAKHGFDTERPFCLDTFHSQRKYGREKHGPVSNPDDTTLGALAEHSSVAHLSLGRGDIKNEDIPTIQDLTGVLKKGTFSGRTEEALTALRETTALRHIVVEVTSGSLRGQGYKKTQRPDQSIPSNC